ncbi:MAG: TatD family hydrolase [Lautropia sp.]
MYVDSHCHLDFPGLRERLPDLIDNMAAARVEHALCVAVTMEDWPSVLAVARAWPNLSASVGVHPDSTGGREPGVDELVAASREVPVVAIGETGLDYFRTEGDTGWQRERFAVHVRAARKAGLPLIIHTRAAAEDTIRIMREEGADAVGGVMHCFTETREVAKAALDLGFFVSFSGIVTFKNAAELREVARFVPDDRLLIETDSPYLAPVPHRGRTNEPAWVVEVAACLATVRGCSPAAIADTTTANYYRLFTRSKRDRGCEQSEDPGRKGPAGGA